MAARGSNRSARGAGRGGRNLLSGFAGAGLLGCDGSLVWDGSAALVPFPVGDRRRVEFGDAARSARLLSVDAVGRQTDPAALANRIVRAVRGIEWKPYSASIRAHSETVLRCFYQFHLESARGPIINPFPSGRSAHGWRAHAHHNSMDPYVNERTGVYRPTVPSRIPRAVPDDEFNEIFARLPSHRDRALVAFYVSTGARASELLSVTQGRVDPGPFRHFRTYVP